MKKVLVFSFMFFFALAMSAQDTQGGQRQGRRGEGQGGRGGAQRYEQMKKDYNLTDKQVDSLKVIDNEMRAEMQKLREANEGGGGQGFNREAFEKINTKRDARYKKILTEEQYKKYQEQQKAMRERMQQGGGPGGPGGGQRPPREN